MTPANGSHEVSPEFRARLEWQIASALRRETRFAAPIGRRRMPPLGVALVVIVSLAAGGMAVAASDELQEARQRALLIDNAKSEQALVHLRIELARADLMEAQRRFESGTASRETLETAKAQVMAMETTLARIQLDLAEIHLTSAAPRNDLQAPLVRQRDFVTERLRLDLDVSEHALAMAEQSLVQARQRVDVGVAPRTAQLQAEGELTAARARLEQLRAMLDLRRRSLKGEIKTDELASTQRRMELTLQRERLQRELEIARARLSELRRLVEVGQTTALELKRAEVELLEREVALQRVARELEVIGGVRR